MLEPLRDISSSGALRDLDLSEASGIVPSTRQSNTFWSQNDSGNDPDLFAYDSTGASLGVVHVHGAKNTDWEAVSIGPCAESSCLYIADVGDNNAQRPVVTMWRVPEPLSTDTATPPANALRFSYPQGPRDVESMWIGPDTTIWLISKRPLFAPGGTARPAQLYKLPAALWSQSGVQMATLVDSLPITPRVADDFGWPNDAALSPPDSLRTRKVAVRTSDRVYIFAADTISGRPGALEHVCRVDLLNERQGEGVTWLPDRRLMFISEGRRSPLHVGRCP